jgi:malate/lactate dehydrogenase
MDVPLVIGSGGIHDIKVLDLTEEEQAGLKRTISVLEPAMRQVDDFLKA